MYIEEYGWNEYFDNQWQRISDPFVIQGRIIADYGQIFRVVTIEGEILVNKSFKKANGLETIAVGDWIALRKANQSDIMQICGLLNRKTKFSRAAAGIEVKEQIIAANVDTVFLMQSLNRDFNMRRLERYLIAAWESGAMPVIVLTKTDCCDDLEEKLNTVYLTAPGVDIVAISCVTGEGMDNIKKYLSKGKTVALLGSSGVGKSTLVNTLAGKELLKTNTIRDQDSRGRHTTTHREILLIPEGGMILDTPGMRSLSLWEIDSGMNNMFSDVEDIISQCRFGNCSHTNEPNCAVIKALNDGTLDKTRWESYMKLTKEAQHLEAKKEGKARLLEKQWGRKVAKIKKELANK